MKQTRKIFLLHGEESEVRKVLDFINHYEAVIALNDGSEVDNVLSYNKNVAINCKLYINNNPLDIYCREGLFLILPIHYFFCTYFKNV